jgi:tRNA threonylcarbamoyladenosine biosynthesis protein TsaB
VLCVIDARMGEVYSAVFDAGDGRVVAASEERIGRPETMAVPAAPFIAVGDGLAAYPAELAGVIGAAIGVDSSLVPGARELLALAEADVRAKRFVAVEAALPVYLRGADAWQQG